MQMTRPASRPHRRWPSAPRSSSSPSSAAPRVHAQAAGADAGRRRPPAGAGRGVAARRGRASADDGAAARRPLDAARRRHADRARVADQRRHRRRAGDVAEPAAGARQGPGHHLDVRLEPRRRACAASKCRCSATSTRLTEQVKQLFPTEAIEVRGNGRNVVLSGTVSTKDVVGPRDQRRARLRREEGRRRHAAAGARRARPSNQVLLQVRFAEVSRSALTEFGMSFFTSPTGIKNTSAA